LQTPINSDARQAREPSVRGVQAADVNLQRGFVPSNPAPAAASKKSIDALPKRSRPPNGKASRARSSRIALGLPSAMRIGWWTKAFELR